MKIERTISGLLCAACLLTGSALAVSFADVPGDTWYSQAVSEMAEQGIMSGITGEKFDPDGVVSRSMVVTVLWRLAGQPEPAGEPFPDTAGEWYEKAASWCRDVSIAGGYGDGSFQGDKAVTRQELAVFLCNYSKWKGEPLAEGPLEGFADADQIGEWAADAVSHAVGMGILKGDNQNQVNPRGQATRAALALMLQRLLTPAVG